MNRTRIFLPLFAAVVACASAGVAHGEGTTMAGSTGATTVSKTEATAPAHEKQLAKAAQDVDAVAGKGERTVAGRLAGEFGMTTDALLEEKARLGVSWGQLMIAHSLAANADPAANVTAEQLLARRKDGQGWGQISTDLGLEMGAVVSGVTEERNVAVGQAKVDGRVTPMRGVGVKADAGLKANPNASVGLARSAAGAANGVGIGAGAAAGASVGVGHGKSGK